MPHDSPEAEALAELWHRIWFGASMLSLVVAAGGVVWHFWGIAEHRKRRKKLE